MALEALETGDLVKAKSLGDAASAEAVSSMALLPSSSSLPAETIDSLKAQGLHQLADSLANVRRMIDANVFTLKFLGGLAKFGKDEAGEATIAKARGLYFCAFSLDHHSKCFISVRQYFPISGECFPHPFSKRKSRESQIVQIIFQNWGKNSYSV